MALDIFINVVTKGNLLDTFVFHKLRVKSIRGHKSSLIVHRTCFRGDETI